jgi:hypothetical protein
LRTLERGGGPVQLIETLRQQFGRLNFEPSDFVGKGFNSSLFPLVFLVLRERGATDWQTGMGITTAAQGKQHKIQYHHIFPKALLKERYDGRLVNEIANMAFISARTNQRISNKEPSEYLPQVVEKQGQGALERQAIPLDAAFYEIDQFESFLARRRELLSGVVNDFLRGFE